MTIHTVTLRRCTKCNAMSMADARDPSCIHSQSGGELESVVYAPLPSEAVRETILGLLHWANDDESNRALNELKAAWSEEA